MKRGFSVAAILILALAGCVNPLVRPQSSEESERDKDLDACITIGSVTEVANVQPTQVSGVALVTHLNGTGHTPTGQYRTMLEKYLRQNKVESTKAMLDSPDNALVLVTAFIPPGARRGDPLDVEITLPQGSKATSLHGGYLQECVLRDYSSTHTLNPEHNGPERMLQGPVRAKAKGYLLVGMGAPNEPAEMRRARVWQGGVCLENRPFYLVMKKDDQSSRVANAVAERINSMFRDDSKKQQVVMRNRDLYLLDEVTQQLNSQQDQMPLAGDVAKAANKELINVRVPYAYRYNPERYLRVARLVPLREAADKRDPYRRRLHKMLQDPTDTVRAALRLEALGQESIPALKNGLSSDQQLVRFASAEALTYLGSTAGIEELSRLAREQGVLRSFCLLAIAGLDESVCRTRLNEMLVHEDIELRCGAFVALRRLNEGYLNERYLAECRRKDVPPNLPLGAECLGRSTWLHQLAPGSSSLVYFSIEKRAEVVLFGEDIRLVAPIKILVGPDFTVTADSGDDRCTISRITGEGVQRKQCTLRLDEVLRTIAMLGGQYPEIVDLLRKLDERRGLNCPIVVNRLPTAVSIEALVDEGRNPSFLRDHPTR